MRNCRANALSLTIRSIQFGVSHRQCKDSPDNYRRWFRFRDHRRLQHLRIRANSNIKRHQHAANHPHGVAGCEAKVWCAQRVSLVGTLAFQQGFGGTAGYVHYRGERHTLYGYATGFDYCFIPPAADAVDHLWRCDTSLCKFMSNLIPPL